MVRVTIPFLSGDAEISKTSARFLERLHSLPFSGESQGNLAHRLAAAVDNSIYQILPEAVIFPRNAEDLQLIFKLAACDEFANLKFTARGGGTGTNGQSLSSGFIVDHSRFMNQILEVNLDEKWAIVQPGVIRDQLNDQVKHHGLFFSPDLSTSSRATIGGMISTDACGQGSRIYGKTSNHILSLDVVLTDASVHHSHPISCNSAEFKDLLAEDGIWGDIHRQVYRTTTQNRQLIVDRFPKLTRFMTGYNLAHVLEDDLHTHNDRDAEVGSGTFNLNPLLAGSEGTLCYLAAAKVKLTPIPKHKYLVVLRYSCFHDALASAQKLVSFGPSAIETVDETIMQLARDEDFFADVSTAISGSCSVREVKAINLVEFVGNCERQLQECVHAVCSSLELSLGSTGQALSFYHTRDPKEIKALWEFRKRSVGLLGNMKGRRKPIPFVEDSVVPPAVLPEYIGKFQAILDSHGLKYGMFGHVDAGCIHVRPALDMKSSHDEALVRKITDQVNDLVASFGGVLWGEHGKGYRGEYVKAYFGDQLYSELRKIKQAFDPRNVLNPGKICTPIGSEDSICSIESPLRGHYDRNITEYEIDFFEEVIACNGNGLCFNIGMTNVMCPSYKQTMDRVQSPKGRATVLREWVRLISQAGTDLNAIRHKPSKLRLLGGRAFRRNRNDFSHEVFDAMDGCLSCKACITDCPVHVSIPHFKAEFLDLYHSRYRRPLQSYLIDLKVTGDVLYLIGSIEHMAPIAARFPRTMNLLFHNPLAKAIAKYVVGLEDFPKFSSPSLNKLVGRKKLLHPRKLTKLSSNETANTVCIVQDTFTSCFEAHLVSDLAELIQLLGFQVCILPLQPSGKSLHVMGYIHEWKKAAKKNADNLKRISNLGVTLVGLEPSIALVQRDEIPRYELDGTPELLLPQEWLHKNQHRLKTHMKPVSSSSPILFQVFPHCHEVSIEPSSPSWDDVLGSIGVNTQTIATGCCGMCGTYGHESRHVVSSKAIFRRNWQPHLNHSLAPSTALVTGHSCRLQVGRILGYTPQHPIQALLRLLRHL